MKHIGNLEITKENQDQFKDITEVSGNVYINGNTKLEALQTVGGYVRVYGNAKLETPQLQTVSGYVYVYGTAKFEALQTVGGYVSVNGTAKLEALQTVGGGVYVHSGAKLETPLLQTEKPSQEIINKLRTEPKKLNQQHFERQGYLFADGILQTIISKKTAGVLTIYKTKKLAKDEINFVVYDGEYYSHGETLEQAKNDLIFKRTSQDTEKFKEWKLTDKKPLSELIEAYMSITGACSSGTKDFCSNRDLKEDYTIEEAIKITAGAYNSDAFALFFNYSNPMKEIK